VLNAARFSSRLKATKVPPCEGCSEDDTYTGGEVDGEGQDVPGGVRVEITGPDVGGVTDRVD